MTRIQRQAAVLGLLATVLVIAAVSAGWLDVVERLTIDMRFAHGRLHRDPMSPAIAHVDIDDGAIDTVGRWPWPRARLAEAIDELRRAGARAVVLDLALDDASDDPVQDARLAEALAQIPTVLAVTTTDAWEFGDEWSGTEGIGDRFRLLDQLCLDIAADAEAVAEAVGLQGERRRRFLSRPAAFRQVAIWRYITMRMAEANPPADLESLILELSPDAHRGVYVREATLIEDAWTRYHAWLRLRKHLPGELADRLSRDRAPVDVLCAVAASVGFVNADLDLDGAIRFTSPSRDTPVGRALPLGVAAAMLYQGRSPSDVELSEREVLLGEHRFPLHEGHLWIAWPTSETSPAWEGLLRQTEVDPPTSGRISAGALVELAQLRDVVERNEREFEALVREFARDVYGREFSADEPLPSSVIDEVRDDISFFLTDAPEPADASDPDVDPAARRHEEMLRLIHTLDHEIARAHIVIPQLEYMLASQVEGRLVFVGATFTSSVTDVFRTTVGTRTPGVVVHAALADMVLQGRMVRFTSQWFLPALALGLGVLCTWLAVRLGSILSGVAVLLLLIAYAVAAGIFIFDRFALLVPLIGPATAGFTAWLSATAFSAALYQRDRSRITRQFKSRVSPQLVDRLIENPDVLSVSGDEREVTVLFCDLVGFTPMAERLGGPATVAVLNRTLSALTDIITEHHGYVNKFLGDGLMAFWSAFERDSDQARRACRSVIACHVALAAMPDGLRMRAGIATGRVIVGDCGAPPHLNDYTVIGDAVNLAARLESANRHFGSAALIDESTRAALGDTEEFHLRPLGRVMVHGQSRSTALYELLLDETGTEELMLAEDAIGAFMSGDLSRARSLFETCIERFGDRGFVYVYLEAIDDARREPDGALRLSEK